MGTAKATLPPGFRFGGSAGPVGPAWAGAILCALCLALQAAPAAADYPALRPLGEVLQAGEGGQDRDAAAAAAATLEARAIRLLARAAALRTREVIDAPTRARLEAVRARLPRLPDG